MVNLTTKTPSQWIPQSGHGFLDVVGNLNIVTNTEKTLVTNTQKFIVTNPIQVLGKYATAWASTGV